MSGIPKMLKKHERVAKRLIKYFQSYNEEMNAFDFSPIYYPNSVKFIKGQDICEERFVHILNSLFHLYVSHKGLEDIPWDFIDYFKKQLDTTSWRDITHHTAKKYSDTAFIEKYKDFIHWPYVCEKKKDITLGFVEKYKKYVNYGSLLSNKKLPKEVHKSFLDYYKKPILECALDNIEEFEDYPIFVAMDKI